MAGIGMTWYGSAFTLPWSALDGKPQQTLQVTTETKLQIALHISAAGMTSVVVVQSDHRNKNCTDALLFILHSIEF
jgi:hypothetical protein